MIFLPWYTIWGNVIIDFNTFHHSNHLRHLICYTGNFGDNKTIEIVSVAIYVRSYHLKTLPRQVQDFVTMHGGYGELASVKFVENGSELSIKLATTLNYRGKCLIIY